MHSMTAFARAQGQVGQLEWTWEMKSVNHRFLDQFYRLPDTLRRLEAKLRQMVVAKLQRGRLEVGLQLKHNSQAKPNLNYQLIQDYQDLARHLDAKFGIENNLKMSDYFNLPEIWILPNLNLSEDMETVLLASFTQCLDDLVSARAQEGESIATILQTKLQVLGEHLHEIQGLAKTSSTKLRSNLNAKLAQLYAGPFDEQRFEQELVYHLLRIDIHEEMERLDTHLQELKRVLDKETLCGRRLDFLVQECHREVNTMGSKTDTSLISQRVIEMKVIIEQLREQIQNVE